jgi:hypothetical protein
VSAQIAVHVTAAWRISGTVRAADSGGALTGVWVHPTGAADDDPTYTDRAGHYLINWVAGPITVIASAPGFEDASPQSVDADGSVVDFTLRPGTAYADVSGSWTLTVTASETCRDLLPPAALQREFIADITQESAQLTIAVRAASSVDAPIRTIGIMYGTRLETSDSRFNDQLSATQPLDDVLSLKAELRGDEIRGTASGLIEVWPETFSLHAQFRCSATDHAIVLRRN